MEKESNSHILFFGSRCHPWNIRMIRDSNFVKVHNVMIYRYLSGYSSMKKKISRSEYFAFNVNNGNLIVKYYTTLAA